MPTSPTQDGTTPTPSDPVRTSVLGGAGQEAPAGTVNPGTVDESTAATLAVAQAADNPPPAEEAAPEPLTWDKIAVPEGLEVPEDLQGSLLSIFNNSELTPAEVAAQTLALHAQQAQAMWDQQTQLWEQTQNEWREQTRNLPEFQGGRYEQELGKVAKLLNRFGGTEVRKALDLTGAGSHPAVVQFFHKVAKELMEDEPATGEVVVQAPRGRSERLYGNNKQTGG